MKRRAVVMSLALAAALGAALETGRAPLAALAQDSAPREWNQARGDEARSGMSAFDPVAASFPCRCVTTDPIVTSHPC